MKKVYENAQAVVINMSAEDIISTSAANNTIDEKDPII